MGLCARVYLPLTSTGPGGGGCPPMGDGHICATLIAKGDTLFLRECWGGAAGSGAAPEIIFTVAPCTPVMVTVSVEGRVTLLPPQADLKSSFPEAPDCRVGNPLIHFPPPPQAPELLCPARLPGKSGVEMF